MYHSTVRGWVRTLAEAANVLGPVLICIEGLVWPDEFKDLAGGKWSLPATILAASLAILLAVSVLYILDRKRAERFGERTDELRHDALAIAARYQTESAGMKPSERLRFVLWAIADVVKRFAGEGTRCGANLMAFSDKKPGTVFFDDGAAVVGYLVLHKTTSASCPGTVGTPDEKLSEFSLPIAKNRDKCLPGAPAAFRTNRVKYYKDFRRLLDWCKRAGFSTEIQKQIREYFTSDGALVQSMICIPISIDREVVDAILNVHTNTRAVLADEEQAIEFSRRLGPLVGLLESIVRDVARTGR